MTSHDEQVNCQLGPVAAAYLTSSVHAKGADLIALAERLQGQSALNLLDLGCGAGHLSFAVAPYVRSVTAFDLSEDMLCVVMQEAQTRHLDNIHTHQGVAEDLPFADHSFEYICTRYSAHHWADVPRALSEMHRVLKVGGQVVIIDVVAPTSPLLDTYLQTVELLRDLSHVRNYSREDWLGYLADAGFKTDGFVTWNLRLEFQAWVARMRTPAERVAVIRELLVGAPQEVRAHFKVEADGSFQLEAAMLYASEG